jgi:hypothetical protein
MTRFLFNKGSTPVKSDQYLVVSCGDTESLKLAYKIAALMMPLHVLMIDGITSSFSISGKVEEKFGSASLLWIYQESFKTWCHHKNKRSNAWQLEVNEQLIQNKQAS